MSSLPSCTEKLSYFWSADLSSRKRDVTTAEEAMTLQEVSRYCLEELYKTHRIVLAESYDQLQYEGGR